MSKVAQELEYSAQRDAAYRQSISTFTTIASATQTLIAELSGDAPNTTGGTLRTRATSAYNGVDYTLAGSTGWVADRMRFLSAFPPPLSYPGSIFIGISSTITGSNYGSRDSFTQSLSNWSLCVAASAPVVGYYRVGTLLGEYGLPGGRAESISAYAQASAYGVYGWTLSGKKNNANGSVIYAQDVFQYVDWNQQHMFVSQYLWDTPTIALGAGQVRNCNGLVYSLATMQSNISYQQSQIAYEQCKYLNLSKLV